MNKQELIAHFQEQKKVAEREITFWQAQPDDAPERPKLGHGDFGLGRNKRSFVLVGCGKDAKAHMGNQDEEYWGESTSDGRYFGAIKFGNIFDLMKDWGEDAKSSFHSKSGREGIGITIDVDNKEIWLGNTGDSDWYSYEQAYEIWCELGKRLMTLKRKENK